MSGKPVMLNNQIDDQSVAIDFNVIRSKEHQIDGQLPLEVAQQSCVCHFFVGTKPGIPGRLSPRRRD